MATSSQRFTGSAALAISTALKVFDDPPVDFDKYDICLEFPVDTVTNKLNPIGTEVMNQLISIFGSKYVSLFYSKDTSKIYALIRAALKLVRTKAEIDRFKLLLDANAAKNRAFDGDEEARVNGFSIPHVPEVSPIEPFRFIYGEYITRPDAQELYYKEEGSSHPFTKLVRIKLMSRILHATRSTEGEYRMSLEYLRLGGVILDFNAVHEPQALEELRERWLSVFFVPWGQPFGLIKNYFGEKMGFYFYFLGFLSFWFLLPALVGVAFEIMALVDYNFNRPELPVFAVFISIWALTMTRYWRRNQMITAMKWNTLGITRELAEREEVRYDYYGQTMRSPVDGSETVYFNNAKRMGFYCVSAVFIALTLVACLVSVAALFYLRSIIRRKPGVGDYDQWIFPALISAQISIANRVIYHVASGLTRVENHRLDEDFDYALTSKLFFMQFINASSSFYYLAFAAKNIPDMTNYNGIARAVRGCGPDDCITTLHVHVLVVIATQVLLSVLVFYWIPFFVRAVYYCDPGALWASSRDTTTSWYEWWGQCWNCLMHTSVAQCCMRGIESTYYCCCGGPQATPVPQIRTNLGQSIDRSTFRSVDRGSQDISRPQSDELSQNRVLVLSEIDNYSDLGDNDTVLPEEGKHGYGENRPPMYPQQSQPMSIRSFADLRMGLTSRSRESSERRRSQIRTSTPTTKQPGRQEAVVAADPGGNRDSVVLGAGGNRDSVVFDQHVTDNQHDVVLIEKQFTRYYTFDQDHQLRRSYARVMLIVALILCFGSLFPASFLLGALFFRAEVRGKAWQLLMIYKRTFPFEVEDIGSCWNRVFQGLGTLAVLTNAALICFAMRQFDDWSWLRRVLLFIGIVMGLRVFQSLLDFSMDEVPAEVVIQQKRAKFISDKLIRKIPDRKSEYAMEIL